MKKHLVCLALLSLSLHGCANSVPLDAYFEDQAEIEKNFDNADDRLTAVEAQITMAQSTVDELNKKIEMQEEKLVQLQAKEMQREMVAEKARQEQIAKEKAKQEQAAKAKATPAKQPAPSIAKITSKQLTEKQAYDEALRFYQTGRFQEAHNAFLAFRETYPTTQYAANAIYWSGESYYAQEKYSQAILQFKDLIARFPENNKVPDALLKIALAYQKLGDATSAGIHTTVLLEDWPSSDAAKKARRLNLQTISQ